MSINTFVTDGNGKRISAIVPIKEYQKLLKRIEKLESYIEPASRKKTTSFQKQTLKKIDKTKTNANNK